jgi:hypothetical protein
MSGSWRWWLVVPVVAAAFLVFACGGGDEEPSDTGPADGGAATEQMDGESEDAAMDEEPSDGGMEMEAGGEAFSDVPLPEGASVVSSGEWSGSIPGAVPGMGAELEDYTSLEFRQIETDASPEDVINFYSDQLSDWDELFVFSGGAEGDEGGVGVWTHDDVAVWISAATSDGTTDAVIIRGSR